MGRGDVASQDKAFFRINGDMGSVPIGTCAFLDPGGIGI
jgi:hypothetical protein